MASQFSPKVSAILAFSREEATRLASSSVGPEHLLLGLLRERTGIIPQVLSEFGVNISSIKRELELRVREDDITKPIITHELVLNDRANNILKLSVLEARMQRTEIVDSQHLLLAILHDSVNNGAKEILEFNNMNYEDTLIFLKDKERPMPSNGIGLSDHDDEEETGEPIMSNSGGGTSQATVQTRKGQKSKTPVLDNFSVDLTQAAADGKLDPVVGREREIQRLSEILCRRKKNNPVLIGEPGVGKSAIVEGLAQMIVHHHTSPVLFNKRVVSLDMTSVVAGTKYRGQFEERMKAMIKELEANPDIIVFMDEIHTLIGAGSTAGTMDAANILKPALARGTVQCIGATTLDEFRNSIEKDGALERRFQKIIVEPTTSDETLQILHNIKSHYENHHHVLYTDEALSACVRLTARYVNDRFFPDKAIDALDEAGARVHLQHAEVPEEITDMENEIEFVRQKKLSAVNHQNFELAASYRDRQKTLEGELQSLQENWMNSLYDERKTVTDTEVADVVSIMTGIPLQELTASEGDRLRKMPDYLKQSVIAQDQAIDKIVKAIQRNRVGLKAPNRPVGAFMFLGPTGVGKTHLAKKLAQHLFGSEDSVIRVDMSEYTESFNTSRLVGAPPGYVGYEQGGQLTEQIRRKPYSIVLLDEIEKAHQNVYNMLLQVLDEGRLTDGNGRLIDFRNTIIIMTSNTGTRQLKDFGHGVGFTAGKTGTVMNDKDKEYARSIIQKSLARQFAPEFLNRLDEIITFDQLDLEAIKKIIDIELKGLYQRVEALGYHLDISDSAKSFVAEKGYDVQYGARPLKRAIQNYIEDGVCELILGGELTENCHIQVTKEDQKTKLSFHVE